MLPTSAFEQRRHRDDVRPFGFDDDFAGSGRLEWWCAQSDMNRSQSDKWHFTGNICQLGPDVAKRIGIRGANSIACKKIP